MSQFGWRPYIESAKRLRLAELFRAGALQAGGDTSGGWQWTRDGETVAAIGYKASLGETDGTLRLFYTWTYDDEPKDVTCVIRLSSVPLNYGGRRWYLHCPYTGRRALMLYKFGAIEQFCHRTAIRPLPTYASQRTGGYDRIMEQRWALRRKLGDNVSDLFGGPCKPKWMRWHTFERYASRDAELAGRERSHLRRILGDILI